MIMETLDSRLKFIFNEEYTVRTVLIILVEKIVILQLYKFLVILVLLILMEVDLLQDLQSVRLEFHP